MVPFQSTLPHGSDSNGESRKVSLRDFNPRSLTGATTVFLAIKRDTLFQSTLPHGSDSIISISLSIDSIISIHAPSRERLLLCRLHLLKSLFQSTLPHGSDDDAHIRWSPITGISIHAPSRERPGRGNGFSKSFTISIHAPSRERPQIASIFNHMDNISIHAPSRERHFFIKHSLLA